MTRMSRLRSAVLGMAAATVALTAAPALAQNTASDRITAYQQRVERLEDAEAIENLTAYFGYYFDKGMWADVADLFVANGSFEYGQRGVYVGKERIARALLLFGPEGLGRGYLNNHMMLQPIIEVAADGRTATGRWQGMVQLAQPGVNGVWGVGIFENAYVKDRGVWKIAALTFYVTGLTDYDKGWMASSLPMEGPSALFPPDRGPTHAYRTYPSAFIPPFSFQHPVTGTSLKSIVQPADDVVRRP